LLDCHWPELSIGDGWPVNGCMDQHGSSDGHDCLDGLLGNSIMMVGTDSSELGCLFELGEVISKGLGCEG
jgi:hypothetical protein